MNLAHFIAFQIIDLKSTEMFIFPDIFSSIIFELIFELCGKSNIAKSGLLISAKNQLRTFFKKLRQFRIYGYAFKTIYFLDIALERKLYQAKNCHLLQVVYN